MISKRTMLYLFVGLFLISTLPGCTLATVRTLDEDKASKQGFSGEDYVAQIWESKVLPTYQEQAQDLPTLLALIASNQQSAITQYGHRSGTGPYSFMVKGEGKITRLDTTSRTGVLLVDLNPPDGTPDITLIIGPLIKISQRAAVRDAVGFVEYGNFVNQQEFADVANAMGDRITAMVATALGAENVDAIRTLDPTSLEGKTIAFTGAFSLEKPDEVIIVPVDLKVLD
jgi:predicted lipoprotein